LLILSALYVRHGEMSGTGHFLGFQIGALVVIIQSTISMARPYKKKLRAWIIGFMACVAVYYLPRYEPVVLIFFGIVGAILARGVVGKSIKKSQDTTMPKN